MSNNDFNIKNNKSKSGIVVGKIKEDFIEENKNHTFSDSEKAEAYQEKVIRLLESIHSMIKFFYVVAVVSLIAFILFLIAIFQK